MYARSAPRADLPLGERRRVRVVVDPDREREALTHPLAEVEVGERNVHGRDRPAATRWSIVEGSPKPIASTPSSRSSSTVSSRARREDPPETPSASAAPAGGRSALRSTTPAAIFVPPTSTPIVRPSATWLRYAAEWPREKSPTASTVADASRAGCRRCGKPERAPARTDRKPFRFKGPGPKPGAKGSANWRRRILIGVVVLFVLLLVWGVASYLALRGGASREQAPLAVGQGRPRAAERAHPLAPVRDPAHGHRPLVTDQGARPASSARTR